MDNSKFIGTVLPLEMGGMVIEVKVKDYKNAYGRDRFLITPLAGYGEVWVDKQRLMGGRDNPKIVKEKA